MAIHTSADVNDFPRSLTRNDNNELANHLPMLIRGIFYENWHPDITKLGPDMPAHFVATVAKRLKRDELESRQVIAEVFKLLEFRLNPHIIAKLEKGLGITPLRRLRETRSPSGYEKDELGHSIHNTHRKKITTTLRG